MHLFKFTVEIKKSRQFLTILNDDIHFKCIPIRITLDSTVSNALNITEQRLVSPFIDVPMHFDTFVKSFVGSGFIST